MSMCQEKTQSALSCAQRRFTIAVMFVRFAAYHSGGRHVPHTAASSEYHTFVRTPAFASTESLCVFVEMFTA